ncbi:unnamed protein product [Amoebophrya sp. A120]|nr:unnamed protein product [Amoebophrya sp. A120]|eukprot:GSA120T00019121001.1
MSSSPGRENILDTPESAELTLVDSLLQAENIYENLETTTAADSELAKKQNTAKINPPATSAMDTHKQNDMQPKVDESINKNPKQAHNQQHTSPARTQGFLNTAKQLEIREKTPYSKGGKNNAKAARRMGEQRVGSGTGSESIVRTGSFATAVDAESDMEHESAEEHASPELGRKEKNNSTKIVPPQKKPNKKQPAVLGDSGINSSSEDRDYSSSSSPGSESCNSKSYNNSSSSYSTSGKNRYNNYDNCSSDVFSKSHRKMTRAEQAAEAMKEHQVVTCADASPEHEVSSRSLVPPWQKEEGEPLWELREVVITASAGNKLAWIARPKIKEKKKNPVKIILADHSVFKVQVAELIQGRCAHMVLYPNPKEKTWDEKEDRKKARRNERWNSRTRGSGSDEQGTSNSEQENKAAEELPIVGEEQEDYTGKIQSPITVTAVNKESHAGQEAEKG